MTEPQGEATQGDREAAWHFRPDCYLPADRERWMNGAYDNTRVIQRVVAHREAALAAQRKAYEARIAELEAALLRISGMCPATCDLSLAHMMAAEADAVLGEKS